MPSDPKATSLRIDAETDRLWEALAARLGLTKTAVFRLALRALARREGVK